MGAGDRRFSHEAIVGQLRAACRGTPTITVSLGACGAGLIAAKLYYLGLHRDEPRRLLTAGMCIQGFLIGAIAALLVGALVGRIRAGSLLDVTTPGLLFAMAIGRIGCFLGGCCAGRPSASRWALWSSDRFMTTRQIPTQLWESALSAVLGASALVAVAWTPPQPAGSVFVGAIATYTLGRQLLLPLRDLPRKTVRGRTAVLLATGVVIAIDVAVAALA